MALDHPKVDNDAGPGYLHSIPHELLGTDPLVRLHMRKASSINVDYSPLLGDYTTIVTWNSRLDGRVQLLLRHT